MARPPKDYSQSAPYTPSPPPVAGTSPEQMVRATWDEFYRIAAYLADPAQPVTLALRGGNDADQSDPSASG